MVYKEKGLEAAGAELDKLAALQAEKHSLDVPKYQACVKAQDEKAVRASLLEGDSVGVDATPAMFVNGQKLDGAVPRGRNSGCARPGSARAGVAPPEHKTAATDGKTPPSTNKLSSFSIALRRDAQFASALASPRAGRARL